MSQKMKAGTKWQKILYRRQPFPDNYSGGDEKFLSEMRKNVSVVHYNYWDAVFGSVILLTHIDLITLYFVLFLNTLHSNWSCALLYTVLAMLIIKYLFYCLVLNPAIFDKKQHWRTIISLFLFGYAFTPVIRTLTTSISTDTIYAVSIISALISCIFHDYGVKAPIVSFPISMSAGLSSAIFLLSRLQHDTPAFVLLIIAFVLHAYESDFRNRFFSTYPKLSTSLFSLIATSSIYFIRDFSEELSIFWIIAHFFFLFVCPYILICKQTGKCTIHGPWDEAVPLKNS